MTKAQFAALFGRAALCSSGLGVAINLAACGQNNQYAAPPPPKVTVTAPIERQIPRYFESTGNTAAVNSVDLVARVQGFVQAISYTDGDFVKKGTSLFTIEPQICIPTRPAITANAGIGSSSK
jgi:multidrug efflux pump subunit AcrA (membrane-fusion protein)